MCAASSVPTTPTRVLLVDAQALLRGALTTALDAETDFVVVGQAATSHEAVNCAGQLHPDIVVLDADVADVGPLTARLREAAPAASVVVLAAEQSQPRLVAAVRAGAQGFLLKDLQPADLFDGLRKVRGQQCLLSPSLIGALFSALCESGPAGSGECADALSARELEILQLAGEGYSNRSIGQRLFITEGTVKNHMHNALRKLNVHSRSEAVRAIATRDAV